MADGTAPRPGNDPSPPKSEWLKDLASLGPRDYATLVQFLKAELKGEVNDDSFLLEHLVQLLAKLPVDSKESAELSGAFVGQLWDRLDHPPSGTLDARYRYREADGSYNNIGNPTLGAANTAYGRSTRPAAYPLPNPPEAGQLFDLLMARGAEYRPHPSGLSSMLFYLGTIIIHDVFQTSPHDASVNLASSYLDLSPLYGRNAAEVAAMRTFADGRLKPDCFSSVRILGFPPGCGVFLVMFNRFHNYVATQLAAIDEQGRFSSSSSSASRDEDLFQTARLVTCGLYVNVVLKDYVRTILGLNRTHSTWDLDPRAGAADKSVLRPAAPPQGVGNRVSVEFNLIYRWHSTVSPRDAAWTAEAFARRLPAGVDPETMGPADVAAAMRGLQAEQGARPPEARTWGDLERAADGTLDDDALVRLLAASVEDLAGAYGAANVPRVLRAIEVLGIQQARAWGVATLNEYRAFMGLTRHATFEAINPDPTIAARLRALYGSPDAVELYPGVVVEKTKQPMVPGAGLCGNFTMTWAILSDAVALVRGDRFYTTDYTPQRLTNWGYDAVRPDLAVDQGCVMARLILRAFPRHFAPNSIHAHFPFVTPSANRAILTALGTADLYTWAPPAPQPAAAVGARPPGPAAILLATAASAGPDTAWAAQTGTFTHAVASELLRQHSVATGQPQQREADVVADVIGPTAVRWAAAAVLALRLKTTTTTTTTTHPGGAYTATELFAALVLAARAAGLGDVDDVAGRFARQQAAREAVQRLGRLVAAEAKAVDLMGATMVEAVERALAWLPNGNGHGNGNGNGNGEEREPEEAGLKSYGQRMVARCVEAGQTIEQAVHGTLIPLAAASVTSQTLALALCLDYYLGDGRAHLATLQGLATDGSAKADALLMRYMLEGCRLGGAPTIPAHDDDDHGDDAAAFPDPDALQLDRPLDAYVRCRWGVEADRAAMAGLFKAMVAKRGLRRVEGPRGVIKTVPVAVWPGQVGREAGEEAKAWSGSRMYMLPDQSAYSPIPTTMWVRWDE
ncbi:hypothetical protein P8C59_000866 [Phyllachora maydis]|uniref:Heme peroxidase n=1 Tax=Phyllachora maydis TaxID=1825666 RepID=A0AAD9HX19_9PEZI|nr:hypothetical protein P8C59_000866 [Phyllachora maydis]